MIFLFLFVSFFLFFKSGTNHNIKTYLVFTGAFASKMLRSRCVGHAGETRAPSYENDTHHLVYDWIIDMNKP